jgi:hypothetical protein
MERGTVEPSEEDLAALGRIYDCTPSALMREAVLALDKEQTA